MAARVVLLVDEKKGEARAVLERVKPWLEERAEIVATLTGRNDVIGERDADLCLVFGGDGSILSAARRMGRNQIPTLGINVGRLGFLTEASDEHFEETVERALAGELLEEPRMLLECELAGEAEPILVLNDAVVQRGDEPALLAVSAWVGGKYVTTYVGDGAIVATPVGSTAYSLAAGGPVVAPDVEALTLTPLAPHALPVRPLVVSASEEIELAIEGRPEQLAGQLALDGQVRRAVHGGDRILLRQSATRFRLLVIETNAFFSILRQKFGWAGTPRYTRQEP